MNNSKTRICFLIAILIVLLALAGCTNTASSQPTSNDVPAEASTPAQADAVIGLALSTLDNPFFMSVQEGATEAAARLKVDLIVEDAANDVETQQNQIQALIEQDVSAILLNPVDGDAIIPAVEAANEAGIPLLTIDRAVAGGEVVTHVASDNLAGGEMAGKYLVEAIGENGNVVELVGIPGTSAAQERGEGFHKAIETENDIVIVAQEIADFDRAKGKEIFSQVMTSNPQIDAVFAHNDEMILGALEAAKSAGRDQEIVFVGFDAIDDAVEALENGELTATIAQQPAEMGRLGVEMTVDYLNGEPLPEFIPVNLALVTK